MATYYWVGGSGTWDGSTTTNWSLTSGGSGGAGVPTSSDDVVFNTSSGTNFTVTVDTSAATAVCNGFLSTSSASVEFTGGILRVHGSFQLQGVYFGTDFDVFLRMNVSQTSGVVFQSARTITDLRIYNNTGAATTVGLNSDITTGGLTIEVSLIPSAIYSINCGSIQLSGTYYGPRVLGSASYALAINLVPTGGFATTIFDDTWSNVNDSILNTTLNITPNAYVNLVNSNSTTAVKEVDVNVTGGTTAFNIQGVFVKNLVPTNAGVRLDGDLSVYGNITLVGTASVFDSSTTRNVLLQKKIGSPNVSRTVTVPSTAQWTKAGLRNLISTGTDTVTISGAFGTSVNPVLDFWTGGASVGAGPVYAENVRLSNGASLSSTVFYVNTNFTIIASSTLTGTYTVNTNAALLNPNGVLVPNLNIVGLGSPAYLTTNLSVTNLSITASSSTGGLYVLNGSSVAIGGTFTLAGSSLVNNVEFKAFAYSGTPLPFSVTKSSGLVNALFATIAYSNASGGATFQALEINGCVDGGNNTGWIFKQAAGNFFLFI